MLDQFRNELTAATNGGLYLTGLSLALTIPDMAGGLNSADGRANGARYVEWFDRWAAPKFVGFDECSLTGSAAYNFRCRLLHQGTAFMDKPHPHYQRLIFVPPGPMSIHISNFNGALVLDVPRTVESMLQAFDDWAQVHGNDLHVVANIANAADLHPEGIAPFIVGSAVIG